MSTPPNAAPEPDSAAPEAGSPTEAVEPDGHRVHRFVVPSLLVLATVIGIFAAFAVWVHRQALNTDNWATTSGKVLQDKKVQTALSAYLVQQLFSNVDVAGDLQKVLPKQLQPLSGPAAAGLQQFAGRAAPRVLANPKVQDAWVLANITAHKQLLRVLNGGGSVVSTKSGVVSLDLHALVDQLAASVGLESQVAAARTQLQGSNGATARALAQQKLGVTLPPQTGRLVIMRQNQLKTAQDVAHAIDGLAIVLPALTILLFALAVYLARGRRRRVLRTTGWCFVLIGVVLLLIRRVAGNVVVDGLVKVPSNKEAIHHVWNIGTSLLFAIAVALIAYGLVTVAAAWLAGPTRSATEVRKLMAPTLRDNPAVAYGTVGGALLLLVLIGPTPAFRSVVWVILFAVLLAWGVAVLIRQTAREFPDAEQVHPWRDFRERRIAAKHAREAREAAPVATTASMPAPGGDRVDALERLAALHDRGAISDEEYQAEKTVVMSGSG